MKCSILTPASWPWLLGSPALCWFVFCRGQLHIFIKIQQLMVHLLQFKAENLSRGLGPTIPLLHIEIPTFCSSFC